MLTMGRRRFRSQRRTAAPARQPPFHQEERTGGCRRGAGSQAPPQGARSKAFPGGRPSAVVAGGTAGVPFAPLASSLVSSRCQWW